LIIIKNYTIFNNQKNIYNIYNIYTFELSFVK